ncbi:MAG: hypothetical protein U1E21_18265 [Reyranellaceae bacterium]
MSLDDIKTVRFGVFVQGRALEEWEWRAIELLRAAGPECLFIFSPPVSLPRGRIAGALDGLVLWIAGLPAKSRTEDQDLLQFQPSLTVSVERPDARKPTLDSTQRLRIADRGLKFILFFGAGEVPSGLAACAELGVWRFTKSSGSVKQYPFIDGLARRDDTVSFGLEQISEQGDRRRVLRDGHFRARGECNRSVARQVLSEASRWPLLVLKHVLLNGDLPRSEEGTGISPGHKNAIALILSLLSREVMVNLTSKLASYFVLETWNIGFVRMNFRTLLAGASLSDVALLPRREFGRYIADPFILSTTPILTLLAEDFSDFGVGRISEVTVRDPFGTPEVGLKVCLESRHHLSYPFVFREDGATYCLPECAQSNGYRLYRYDSGKLAAVADLLPGARVTDGTILFHERRYWLFCSLEDDNDQVNLHLFFSESLRGSWSPHPLNPVKTDVRSSRSAGQIIALDGVLFRPTQDCSRSYGSGLSINRIQCLTVTRFNETVVATIRPETISRSCKGLHTLSIADDLLVVDVKFHLLGFEPILVRALRRMKRARIGLIRAIRSLSHSA